MLNHITIMGRLTRDPELRRTQSGTPVTSFSLAVDRDFKSQSGEKETDFIDVVAWRATAEFVAKYFTKGRMAVVEGRLQIRDWTDKDGGKRRNAAKKRELEAAEKRIGELSAIFKRLYEDSVAGRITDERFSALSADYEAEQRQVREHAAELQAELSKAQEASVNAERFMNIVRRHISFEELTPTLLREFIEKIVVHECSYDENKHRRQEIEIYYSFVGKVDLPDE